MMLRLTDQSGHAVIVNDHNWTHIGQAADANTKQVLLGLSVIFFLNGTNAVIKGSPDDIADLLEGRIAPARLETNGMRQ